MSDHMEIDSTELTTEVCDLLYSLGWQAGNDPDHYGPTRLTLIYNSLTGYRRKHQVPKGLDKDGKPCYTQEQMNAYYSEALAHVSKGIEDGHRFKHDVCTPTH